MSLEEAVMRISAYTEVCGNSVRLSFANGKHQAAVTCGEDVWIAGESTRGLDHAICELGAALQQKPSADKPREVATYSTLSSSRRRRSQGLISPPSWNPS